MGSHKCLKRKRGTPQGGKRGEFQKWEWKRGKEKYEEVRSK